MIFVLRPATLLVLLFVATGCRGHSIPERPSPVGTIRESVPLESRPYGLAVGGNAAFVTQLDAATVTRINLTDPVTVHTGFAVGAVPTDVGANRDGSLLMVANQHAGYLSLIDVATGLQTRFPLRGNPFRTLLSHDGRRAYASSSTGDILAIDLASREPLGAITISRPTNGLALSSDDTRLFASSTSGGITIVDVKTMVVVRLIDVPGRLQDVVVAPDASELYVADENGSVAIVSLASGGVSRVPVRGAFGLALTLDGTQLWVTQPLAGRITVLDRRTQMVIRTIPVDNDGGSGAPRRIAFTRHGLAVVTDEAGRVHIIR